MGAGDSARRGDGRPVRGAGRDRHPAQPHRGAGPPARLRALPRPLRRRRRVHRRVSHPELPPEPLRRGRALGVVHPGLRAPPRRGRSRGGGARRGRGGGAARAGDRSPHPRRRVAHAVADRRDRAGLRRREARPDDPPGPHPLPGRRAARPVGVVPRRPEQPPALPALVHGAGRVERRDDRRRWSAFGGRRRGIRSRRRRRVGLGRRERAAAPRAAPDRARA